MGVNDTTLNLWAMKVGLGAAYLLILGGIPCTLYDGNGPIVGYYSIGIGAILIPFFWPVRFLGPMLLLFQQFWVAGILLILLSGFSFSQPPTFLGALCLAISGIIYLVAGFRKEKKLTWQQVVSGPRVAS